jgi:hypothetical protein
LNPPNTQAAKAQQTMQQQHQQARGVLQAGWKRCITCVQQQQQQQQFLFCHLAGFLLHSLFPSIFPARKWFTDSTSGAN